MGNDYRYRADLDIWKDFKEGNEQAFAYLYNRHVVALYHYGNRIAADQYLIEDCIQDLFIELWRNRQTLSETDSVKFYLFKALKRKMVKKIVSQRKQSTESVLPDEYDFEMTLSPEFEMIANQSSHEQKEKLLLAMNTLTARQKEAITLKYYDGLSYQEVASLLAMTVKAAYNLIYRAIEALKSNFDKIVLMLIAAYF